MVGYPQISLDDFTVDRELLAALPREVALRFCILPIWRAGPALLIAVLPELGSLEIPRLLKKELGIITEPVFARPGLRELVQECYSLASAGVGVACDTARRSGSGLGWGLGTVHVWNHDSSSGLEPSFGWAT